MLRSDFIVEALGDSTEEVWPIGARRHRGTRVAGILQVLHAPKLQERPDAATARRFQMCVEEAILYVEGLVRAR